MTRLQWNCVADVRRADSQADVVARMGDLIYATGCSAGQFGSYAARVPTRTRLLAWLAGVALVIGAVIVLRSTDDQPTSAPPPETSTEPVKPPVRIAQYAADNVVLPQAGERPPQPSTVVATPMAGRLLLSWTGDTSAGYEVRWSRAGEQPRSRLVIAPDTQLDGLVDGQSYKIEVLAVDAFGRRSTPSVTSARPGGPGEPWRSGLTGLFDDFSDPHSVLADVSGSHWHVSGYRGCVDLGPGSVDGKGLPIDLGCGADLAVLRARRPLLLAGAPDSDDVLGKVVVVTDTAGPGGELTVDLVPGPADRVGAGRTVGGGGSDPSLPPGTIRAVVNDTGAQVRTGPGVPSATPVRAPVQALRRGPGVLHRFEVRITTHGVEVRQDDAIIAVGGARPDWQQASVLLGFRGPDGHRARVHLAAAGFSGVATALPPIVEAPVNPGTRQVLGLAEGAPGIGIARTPLRSAVSARLVATMTTAPGLDVAGTVVQLGSQTLPARPATGTPAAPGSAVTVIADIPAELLGSASQDSLSPFVVRAPGAGDGVSIVESYLEITPGPNWSPPPQTGDQDTDPRRPAPDALPTVGVTLGNASGAPLATTTVPGQGTLVLIVELDASIAQWDSGGVAGVQGFELWLDGRRIASLPTAADGPGVGGRYPISIALRGLTRGPHVFDVREFGPNGAARPTSLLRNFSIS